VTELSMRKTHPRWWTVAIIKNWKNCDISATVWPILTKLSMVMHLSPLDVASCYDFRSLKIKDGRRPPSWKMEKLRYLCNCLSDFDELSHGDASGTCITCQLLRLMDF